MAETLLTAGRAAAVAREHLWRDVTGFLGYHLFMALPTFLPFRWSLWLAPSVGDWSERDARWTFALEDEARVTKSPGEQG